MPVQHLVTISTDNDSTTVEIEHYLRALFVPYTLHVTESMVTWDVSVLSRHEEDAIIGLQRLLFSRSLPFTLTFK